MTLLHNDLVDDDEDVSSDLVVGDRILFTKYAREKFPQEIHASGDTVDGVFVVTEVIKASDGSWSRFRRSLLTPHPKVFDHSSIPYGHKEQMPLVVVTSMVELHRRG